MNFYDLCIAKLFCFFVVLLSLIISTKFYEIPNCMASQAISTETILNFKDLFQGGQGFLGTDYFKEALKRCRCHIIQANKIARLLKEWKDLIHKNKDISDEDKLEKVNQFFNQMEFLNDLDHWGEEDYWATPFEFIACQAGDCEDFSIAKYFTLDAMGVPEEKLSLTYVKALKYNTYHMVLTYYSRLGAEPLILDNNIDNVKSASNRSDLIPIYSFNGKSLWLAEQRGRGKLAGGSYRLKRWQDLLERMPEENFSVYF